MDNQHTQQALNHLWFFSHFCFALLGTSKETANSTIATRRRFLEDQLYWEQVKCLTRNEEMTESDSIKSQFLHKLYLLGLCTRWTSFVARMTASKAVLKI